MGHDKKAIIESIKELLEERSIDQITVKEISERWGISRNTLELAMANAISKILSSISASSLTTIAGFIAHCFMTFTLGFKIGIVMAKGVLIGAICRHPSTNNKAILIRKLRRSFNCNRCFSCY